MLCYFSKVLIKNSPNYYFNNIPNSNTSKKTRKSQYSADLSIPTFAKVLFFPPTIKKWNVPYYDIRYSDSFVTFKSKLLKLIQPTANSVFTSNNPRRINTRLSHVFILVSVIFANTNLNKAIDRKEIDHLFVKLHQVFSNHYCLSFLSLFLLPLLFPYFFSLEFTPCKTEQPLQGMKLQEKDAQKVKSIQQIFLERTYS